MTDIAGNDATAIAAETPGGWIPDASTLGARLALVRQRMHWGNVEKAATECGVPVQSWRRWERDGRAPRDLYAIAVAIANRTGCDLYWLLTGVAYGEKVPTHKYRDARLIVRPPNMGGTRGPAVLRRRPRAVVS